MYKRQVFGRGGTAFGPVGIAGGIGAVYGLRKIGETGYYFLKAADKLDGFYNMVNKIGTPAGVKGILLKGTTPTNLTIGNLGLLYANTETKSLSEFDETLSSMEQFKQISTGGEELYAMIDKEIGAGAANAYNNKTMEVKADILKLKPKPSINPYTGKRAVSYTHLTLPTKRIV